MQSYQQHINIKYAKVSNGTSLLKRFINWCNGQEQYRFGWLAAILSLHGCVLAPLTLFLISMGGMNMVLFAAVIVAMAMTLVTNLAAMPTRVTIPVFIISLLIDAVVIGLAIFRLIAK
jgi:hypothetical protein